MNAPNKPSSTITRMTLPLCSGDSGDSRPHYSPRSKAQWEGRRAAPTASISRWVASSFFCFQIESTPAPAPQPAGLVRERKPLCRRAIIESSSEPTQSLLGQGTLNRLCPLEIPVPFRKRTGTPMQTVGLSSWAIDSVLAKWQTLP